LTIVVTSEGVNDLQECSQHSCGTNATGDDGDHRN